MLVMVVTWTLWSVILAATAAQIFGKHAGQTVAAVGG